MKNTFLLFLPFFYLLSSCSSPNNQPAPAAFETSLSNHLRAVQEKNFELLKSTVPDSGSFHLILPNGKMINRVEEFLDMHHEWFQESGWSMESRVLFSESGADFGHAIVESMLREPERNGKPYFHKMAISYVLKLQDGAWKVVADHASTIEKSD